MANYEDVLNEIKNKKYTDISNRNKPFTINKKTNNTNKKNKVLKKSSYFNDGYDFGDVTKTILSTVGDAATNIGKGFMNTLEGTTDAARTTFGDLTNKSANIQADVWDFFGNKSYANELRKAGKSIKDLTYKNAKMDVTGALLGETNDLFNNNWSEKLNEKSVSGDLIHSVEQGIGNIGAFVGMGYLTGGSNVSTFINSFSSAYGSTLTNALRNGETEKEAKGQAITSGMAEAISEQFFQGIPGLKSAGWADKHIGNLVGKYFSGQTGKVVLKTLDSVGEGIEEILSNALEATFEGIRNKKDIGTIFGDIKNNTFNAETGEAFISALISSALTNGGSTLISSKQKSNIINSYAKEHNISVEETRNLFDSIVENKTKLENEKNYKDKVETEEGLSKQLQSEIKNNPKLDLNELFNATQKQNQTIDNSVNQQVQEIEQKENRTLNNKEIADIRENTINSKQAFQLNENESRKLTDNDRELANSLSNSGFNNTEKSHNLYNVAKSLQNNNKSAKIRFISNENLADMGINIDTTQKTVNGFKKGDTIYININGRNAFETTIGHEIGEAIKSTGKNSYTELKNLVKQVFGEQDLSEYQKAYTDENGNMLTDNIEDEWVNDKLGELFGNENLRNRIADNRTLLQKLIDNIKLIVNKVTGKDQQKLKTLQQQLEDKFVELYKNTDFSGNNDDTALSLIDVNKANLNENQQNRVKLANEYKQMGLNPNTIWLKTGVNINKNSIYVNDIKPKSNIKISQLIENKAYNISDVFEGELLNNYPELKNKKLKILNFVEDAKSEEITNLNSLKALESVYGGVSDTGDLYINSLTKDKIDLEDIVNSHEFQHMIQYIEGKQTETNYIDNNLSQNDIDAKRKYRNSDDEIEAEINRVFGKMNKTQKHKIPYDYVEKAVNDYYKNNIKALNPEKIIKQIESKMWYDNIGDINVERTENIVEREEINRQTNNDSSSSSILESRKAETLDKLYKSNEKYYTKNDNEKNRRNINDRDVDNTSFSLTSNKDSQGRTLTPQQQEYFKDSKVVDDNGNLRVMYRGATIGHNILKGNGIFFSTDYNFARNYAETKSFDYGMDADIKVQEVYLNAKKVFDSSNQSNINILSDALEDEINYWGNKWTKKEFLDKIQRKQTLEPMWEYEKIKDKQFGEYLGESREGYNNDLFAGFNDKNEVVYFQNTYGTLLKNNTTLEEQKTYQKQLVNGEDVSITIYDTPLGQMTEKLIYQTYNELPNNQKYVLDNTIKYLEDGKTYMLNDSTYKIKPYTKTLETQYFDDADNWQYIESGMSNGKDIADIIHDLGYDGIKIYEDGVLNYMVFDSNQIKNVDNINPTTNDDIRYSLTKNEDIAPVNYNPDLTYSRDVELAPIRQDINNLTEQVKNLSNQLQTSQNRTDIAPIRSDNEYNMMKDENYWKSLESTIDNTSELNVKTAKKLAKNMTKELGLKQKQQKDIQSVIQDSFDNGYSLQQIKDELYSQFGRNSVIEKNNEAIDAQKQISKYQIKVSPEIQKNITDYGYWKQKYYGKIKFSNNGSPVDVVYAQLSNQNPAMFPSDIINETDELLRIAEVTDMDKKYSVDYELDDETIDTAANYIYDTFNEVLYANAIKSANDLEQNALQYNDKIKEIPIKKKTRKEVREFLQNGMGITQEDLALGNDISNISGYQLTTPERVNEKVFGREVGRKINEETVYFAKHQEAERVRFLNKERQEIKDLGIKARSKESALVQQYGEGILDDVQLAQQVSDKATQDKIKNAARVLRGKYDDYLDQINVELVDMGYDPIPKRKDYMRHFQELTDKFSQAGIPFNRQALNSENLPTDINGLTEFNVPGKNWFASAQRRTGDKTTYDAITGIDGYLEGASNLMYHTETIQRYRALEDLIRNTYGQKNGLNEFGDDLTSEAAMQRITDIQNGKLSNYTAWIHEQANSIAGKKGALDRGVERALGRKAYTVANQLKKQTGSNMTGFNVRSALTNFISTTIAASKTNKVAMVKGTIDTIQNMFHQDNFIDRSDFLTSRLRNDSSLSKKAWDKISNAGQIFMSGSDWFTSNVIVRSKYYEGIQKGMTETQSMNYANDFGARVMGDRSKGATAEAFNSKTLGILTQFQLETNNQWQYMIHDTKMDFKDNVTKNGGLKAGATVLFQMGQLAAYSYLFNEMFEKLTGSRAAFDIADIIKKLFGLGDDDKDKDFEERMKEAGSELVDALPFASLFGSGGRMPIGEMLEPLSTAYDYVTGGTDKYGNDIKIKDVGKSLKETIPYYVFPTGYGQIKKTAGGLEMYTNEVPGSYTDSGNLRFTADTDTASIIKNGLFGKWSNEKAQDYIDSGYKTIPSGKVQEMIDLGMDSTEYRDYRTGLSNAGTKNADKIDYIGNLNVPINEKNIMASNVLDRTVDMSNYDKFLSYEEFDYAYKNPDKYNMMSAVKSYNDFNTYKTKIDDIREKYSTAKGYSTDERKAKVISYVNSLNLNIPQKAMMIRQYYSSYDNYNNEIVNYIGNLDYTYDEKIGILEQLGMKVDSNGNVTW